MTYLELLCRVTSDSAVSDPNRHLVTPVINSQVGQVAQWL